MNPRIRFRKYSRVVACVALAGCGAEAANSQGPVQSAPDTVQWHAIVRPAATLQAGQRTQIELTGQILAGWHVYGLKQHAEGPIELRFKVDDNLAAQQLGGPTGTATIRRVDPGFGFEIQYYTGSLKLTLPIAVKPQATPGKQQIPVSVRFQSCSERICLPPATVHLLVDIEVQPHV
jgi:hypothetical protein